MALYELAQARVARVDELVGRQAALVLDARVRAGLEHHVDEGVAELALRLGLAVDPPHRGVQRRVALDAVDRVALEAFLVEEVVDDVVCEGVAEERRILVSGSILGLSGAKGSRAAGEKKKGMGQDVQFPLAAAS